MVQREPLPALPPLPPRTAAVTHLVGRNDTWTLGRKLGQGTFATVRLSQGKRTGCLAVVKTTPVGRKQRSRGRLFALREALVLSYLPRHESIPVLYDLVETEDAVHEVMQLAPGIELFEYVRRQPLGKVREDEARRIVAGILEALRHVHESGVLHRDVKVDNVFYEPTTGLITLLDYGLATFYDSATVLDEPWGCVNYASPPLLRLAIKGTPYMSNKGFAGTWAVGVLAQAITTGYFPFTSEDPVDLLKEIESGRRREAKGISDLGKDFFGMMLDPSREGRITARIALAHPWVAPFAKVPSLPRPPKELPKLLSAAKDEDMERAMEGTEVWVRKLVPVHLDKVARELLRCNGRLTNGGERQGGLLDKFAPTSLIEKIKNFRF